jgi:lipoprotein-anchoring transpeptidase ErfK/SrfK
MADYYSVLSSAVAKLSRNVETERRALYARARKAVTTRMRAIDPPVSDDDVNAELAALEGAVARIERDIARSAQAAVRGRDAPLVGVDNRTSDAERAASAGILRAPARRPDARPPRAASPGGQLRGGPLLHADEVQTTHRVGRPILLSAGLAATLVLILAAFGYVYWLNPQTESDRGASPAKVATSPGPNAPPAPAVTASGPTASKAPPAEARRPQAEATEATIPYILRRQLVYYRTTYPAGTIIIIKPQHSLYLVKDNGTALRYSIGIGADCDDSTGLLAVARKDGGPDDAAQSSAPAVPSRDAGAGVPTFSLGDTPCRIRATKQVGAIGQNPASGGFLLFADDMLDLYGRVPVGTKVVVTN